MSGYMVTIEDAKRTDFDDYYKIRCGKSDIYWMGYEAPPQYESLKKVFNSRIVESSFSNIGDKRIYMIKYTKRKMIVGFIQLSLTLDGVEIGYSVMEQYQGNLRRGGKLAVWTGRAWQGGIWRSVHRVAGS